MKINTKRLILIFFVLFITLNAQGPRPTGEEFTSIEFLIGYVLVVLGAPLILALIIEIMIAITMGIINIVTSHIKKDKKSPSKK